MALNAGGLYQEVKDRGFHHLGDRVNTFVHQAALEVHTEDIWPFRRGVVLAGVPGEAGLTFPVGTVIRHVRDSSTKRRFWPLTESEIKNESTWAEPARYYYLEGGTKLLLASGSVAPVDVVYYDVTPWTVGGVAPADANDTLQIPGQYEDVVIELAVGKAGRDDGREGWGEAAASYAEGRYEKMRDGLLRSGDEPKVIRPEEWW